MCITVIDKDCNNPPLYVKYTPAISHSPVYDLLLYHSFGPAGGTCMLPAKLYIIYTYCTIDLPSSYGTNSNHTCQSRPVTVWVLITVKTWNYVHVSQARLHDKEH